MVIAVTNGIKVSVLNEYQPFYSDPLNFHFVFSYKVKIENNSEFTIKLLNRHWYIFDSIGFYHEVQGPGVVGLQPVLEPGTSHEYVSGVNFKSTVGKMQGTYQMERVLTGKTFEVLIPDFVLEVPFILN